ncbi:MAG TPA: HD domain-containing protein, partial [Trueperaceae bacterium]|nr:HD domain-containing protein [Trueperaceae bacterium]
MRLPPSERGHGVEVAKRVLKSRPDASSALVRAALLHDVGKLGFASSVFERIGAHVLPAVAVPAEPRLTGVAGARQARIHHPTYGEALVMAASGDRRVAELVRRHHEPGVDEEARVLHDC